MNKNIFISAILISLITLQIHSSNLIKIIPQHIIRSASKIKLSLESKHQKLHKVFNYVQYSSLVAGPSLAVAGILSKDITSSAIGTLLTYNSLSSILKNKALNKISDKVENIDKNLEQTKNITLDIKTDTNTINTKLNYLAWSTYHSHKTILESLEKLKEANQRLPLSSYLQNNPSTVNQESKLPAKIDQLLLISKINNQHLKDILNILKTKQA